MKKRLIALAALAVSGAAMAQSSINLYGRVDASIGSTKLNNVSTTQLASGRLTASRWGMRGNEDLGGGLKAVFNLETSFNTDDGTTTAGTAFTRHAWVGLAGGFGTVKLGKTDSAYKDIYDLGSGNNNFDSDFTPMVEAVQAGMGNFTSRPNNQIRYESPSLGGLTAVLSHSNNEGSAAAADISALNVRYRAGNLDIGVARQSQNTVLLADEREFTVLGASYNFGVARVSGQYQRVTGADDRKDSEYGLGVTVPVGNFDLSAGVARSTAKSPTGATSAKGSSFALSGTYTLSKRTRVYAGYIDGELKNAAGNVTRDSRMYALGMRHDF